MGIKDIPIANLLIDPENPRLETQASQNETLLEMLDAQAVKLVTLASDIVNFGPNPADLPIVMPIDGNDGRYVVLEGNRRVAALKVLSTPELASQAESPTVRRRFAELGKQFQSRSINSLFCVVVASRQEADHWIQLRHTGENAGAGIVSWGATEAARYMARLSGDKPPHLQILDFVKERGQLSEEATRRLPRIAITNLQRLIDDPYVRSKLGIDVRRSNVFTDYSGEEVVKGLTKVVEDLAMKRINVSHIDNKNLRRDYINDLT